MGAAIALTSMLRMRSALVIDFSVYLIDRHAIYQYDRSVFRGFMRSIAARGLCRLLALLMLWTPHQFASAELIGTEQVIATSQDRRAVLDFLKREEIAYQLLSSGIDPATAESRVAALTDAEVRNLAASIDAAPAGGADPLATIGAAIIAVLLLVGLAIAGIACWATDIMCWGQPSNDRADAHQR